jgi:uncharacterized protein YmfQ (DUF2313 family)
LQPPWAPWRREIVKKLETLLLAAVVLAVAATTQAQDIVDAVTRGDLAQLKELVEKNPELAKARTPRSATLLHVAASVAQGRPE